MIGCLSIFGQVKTRQDDDDDARILSFYFLSQLKAVLSGQSNIHEDEVGSQDLDFLQRFLSVNGFLNFDGGKSVVQRVFEELPKKRAVFDQQYLQPVRHHQQFLHFSFELLEGDFEMFWAQAVCFALVGERWFFTVNNPATLVVTDLDHFPSLHKPPSRREDCEVGFSSLLEKPQVTLTAPNVIIDSKS